MSVKDPTDRAHLWERPERHDERELPVVHDPDFPFTLYKSDGAETLVVHDAKEKAAAIKNGWHVSVKTPVEPKA